MGPQKFSLSNFSKKVRYDILPEILVEVNIWKARSMAWKSLAPQVLMRSLNTLVALTLVLFMAAPVSAFAADDGDFIRKWSDYEQTQEYKDALGNKENATWNMVADAMDKLFDYEEDCFTVSSMESIEDTMNSMATMLSSLLAGIASIALLVGGIGIMNMMLTTVTERTTEIGLKKALGAVPGQIQSQFLMESFLLSMIGGLTGAVFGLALSFGLCKLLGTSFVFNGGAILLGGGFSAAVGIIFGWAPARKASKLNPIDALRAA